MLYDEYLGALGRAVQMCAEFTASRQGLKTNCRLALGEGKFPRLCLSTVL